MSLAQIEFKDESVYNLKKSLDGCAIYQLAEENSDHKEIVNIQKARVDRINGCTVHIYADEHPPPHFHIIYGEYEGSYRIDNCEEVIADAYLKHYYKNILKWYRVNKGKLVKFWNETRPENCTVGKITL